MSWSLSCYFVVTCIYYINNTTASFICINLWSLLPPSSVLPTQSRGKTGQNTGEMVIPKQGLRDNDVPSAIFYVARPLLLQSSVGSCLGSGRGILLQLVYIGKKAEKLRDIGGVECVMLGDKIRWRYLFTLRAVLQ